MEKQRGIPFIGRFTIGLSFAHGQIPWRFTDALSLLFPSSSYHRQPSLRELKSIERRGEISKDFHRLIYFTSMPGRCYLRFEGETRTLFPGD